LVLYDRPEMSAITHLFAGVPVSDLDLSIDWYTRFFRALLDRLAAERIEHQPIETYSNGVRHVKIPDPDGNAIAFAEPPDATTASPRSAGPGA
jgi:hypothetical protein